MGSPYSSALLGALAFSVGRTLLCSKDMRHGCDAFRTIEIGALTGFLAYQTYVQSDVTLLAASLLATTLLCSLKYQLELTGRDKSYIQYPDLALVGTILSTACVTYGSDLMQL